MPQEREPKRPVKWLHCAALLIVAPCSRREFSSTPHVMVSLEGRPQLLGTWPGGMVAESVASIPLPWEAPNWEAMRAVAGGAQTVELGERT